MREWLYTLRERFTPEMPERWHSYVSFSGFAHIDELVTLDSMMCPDLIGELREDDWGYNVQDDFRTGLFRDSDYLWSRQPLDPRRHQLLAVFESPRVSATVPDGFTSCGFDIMDSYLGNSALTNCGPIPGAFSPKDVNAFGLFTDRAAAVEVRDCMRRMQPDDPHLGACEVWAVARRLPID